MRNRKNSGSVRSADGVVPRRVITRLPFFTCCQTKLRGLPVVGRYDAAELALAADGWQGDPAIDGMNAAEMFRRGAWQLLEDPRYPGYRVPTFSGLAGETSITAVFGDCDTDPEPPLEHVVIDMTGAFDPESPDADLPGGPPTGWIPVEGHSGIVVAEDDGVRYWTNSRSGAASTSER